MKCQKLEIQNAEATIDRFSEKKWYYGFFRFFKKKKKPKNQNRKNGQGHRKISSYMLLKKTSSISIPQE